MEQVTLEKVATEAKQLSADEKWALRKVLDDELGLQNGFETIEEIAREQGKRPVSFQELLGPQPDKDDNDDAEADRRKGHHSLEQIARDQGVRPRSFADLLGPEPEED